MNRVWPVPGAQKNCTFTVPGLNYLQNLILTLKKHSDHFCELNKGFDYHACTAVTYKC